MPDSQPKPWLRIAVPVVALALGLVFAWSVFRNTGRSTSAPPIPPAATQPAQPQSQPQPQLQTQPVPETQAAVPDPSQSPAATPVPPPTGALALTGLRALPIDDPQPLTPLGGLDPAAGQTLRLEFSPIGVGVESLDLAAYYRTIRRTEHYRLQQAASLPYRAQDNSPATAHLVPLSALRVTINGVAIDVTGFIYPPGSAPVHRPIWRQIAPGHFEATIVNDQDQPVLRLVRRYTLTPGSYVIRLTQRADNLSGQPIQVSLDYLTAVDLPADLTGYALDMRRVRFGYQLKAASQGADPTVLSADYLWQRSSRDVLGRADRETGRYPSAHLVWPNRDAASNGHRLVWAGMSNRYFSLAAFPVLDPASTDKTWPAVAQIHRLALNVDAPAASTLALAHTLAPVAIAPAAAADFSLNIYAGPSSRPQIRADAQAVHAGLEGLIVYNLGGMCGPCTFEILTGLLIGLLRVLHGYLVFDWALAIVVLVLIVRTILHPVTRWSQIRIQRFGKQMGDLAPKQKKLQEKYASDPQKLREETAKLWREEGVNPAGALGCLPMFLQTPVWIALYATLYFAFELRQQPAFFGMFQWLSTAATGRTWSFLGDLAEADHFIWLPERFHFNLPLLGLITGINILPVILGVVFFIQQKYLTPPTTAPLTPEQQMQQKMIKFMMVFMFPVMMYNAPSGLALYFITNSALGILESKWIRAHIDKHKLLDTPKRVGPAKEGFLARLHRLAEERQKQIERMKQAQAQRPGNKSRRN